MWHEPKEWQPNTRYEVGDEVAPRKNMVQLKAIVREVNPQEGTFTVTFVPTTVHAEGEVSVFWANPRRYPVAGEPVLVTLNPENAVLDVRPDGGGE